MEKKVTVELTLAELGFISIYIANFDSPFHHHTLDDKANKVAIELENTVKEKLKAALYRIEHE